MNVIVLVADDCVEPPNVTDHDVPGGRPASANVTGEDWVKEAIATMADVTRTEVE